MANKKLQKIGEKLDVSEQEIESIQKENNKWKFIYPIAGAVIVVCSTILGFFVGKANGGCTNCASYPFAVVGALSASSVSKKKRFFLITMIITILLSVIGFAAGYKTGQPMFSYAIKYNVYKR